MKILNLKVGQTGRIWEIRFIFLIIRKENPKFALKSCQGQALRSFRNFPRQTKDQQALATDSATVFKELLNRNCKTVIGRVDFFVVKENIETGMTKNIYFPPET